MPYCSAELLLGDVTLAWGPMTESYAGKNKDSSRKSLHVI